MRVRTAAKSLALFSGFFQSTAACPLAILAGFSKKSVKWIWIYQHASRNRGTNSATWRSGAGDENENENETGDLIAKSGKEIEGSELSVADIRKHTHLDVMFMANFGDGCEKLEAQNLSCSKGLRVRDFMKLKLRDVCLGEKRG